ncbi:unnamed protein product [Periconia digitata]|uniref:FAD/NAD(P)-binding domain-containing protein n=1 Tax=Periconia digitata TaxID=1303443 RepID=A0A9W4UDL3_9PLEO|nr:unnamed protein product [Periconia digitata]
MANIDRKTYMTMAISESSGTKQDSESQNPDKHNQSRLRKAANGVRLFTMVTGFFVSQSIRLLRLRIASIYHRSTYKPVDTPKNIVVIGASFAGVHVAKWLADAVPTGYRVILVEKNSHFNFLFAFPRYSVLPGYEKGAFIPYHGILGSATRRGSLLRVQAEASRVTANQVLLANGETITYEYLVVATGSRQDPPAKMVSLDREGACEELRSVQSSIAQARRLAVLGSGAVGVEIAADIKTYFPGKDVQLFTSRDVIMPSFGAKIQNHVAGILEKLGVVVRYNARPQALPDQKTIKFQDGSTEEYDVVLPCTGQTPNSAILSTLLPEAISKQTGRILVKPTFQLQLADDLASPNIFALGDVAEHGGPRMARAVYMQASIVRDNVLELIRGRRPSHRYLPQLWIEGAIQLTIGKDHSVSYVPGDDGNDMLFTGAGYPDDFNIAKGWKLIGAKYPGPEGY